MQAIKLNKYWTHPIRIASYWVDEVEYFPTTIHTPTWYFWRRFNFHSVLSKSLDKRVEEKRILLGVQLGEVKQQQHVVVVRLLLFVVVLVSSPPLLLSSSSSISSTYVNVRPVFFFFLLRLSDTYILPQTTNTTTQQQSRKHLSTSSEWTCESATN